MRAKPDQAGPAGAGPTYHKLAAEVAATITRDIMAAGWPVGRNVGSIPELLQQHGVSHAVMREAIRQIEQNGLAVMRRGFGGLVVAQSPLNVAAQTLATYLMLIDADVVDLARARDVALHESLLLAARRISAADALRLRVLVEELADSQQRRPEFTVRYDRLLVAFAEAADSPLLSVFLKAMFRANVPALAPAREELIEERTRAVTDRLRNVTEGVIAGNPVIGIHLLRSAQPAAEAQLAERAERRRRQARAGAATPIATEILEALDRGPARKHSLVLALSMARDIAAHDWPSGHNLGLEPELLAKYKVSRSVFREAVRILELHGVVQAKRGQRGGLVSRRARPDYAVRTAATYLRFAGVEARHVAEARRLVQPSLAGWAAGRPPEIIGALHASLDASDPTDAVTGFLRALGPASGNRGLTLANETVLELETGLSTPSALAPEDRRRLCAGILQAIGAGDAALAQRLTMDLCHADYPGVAEPDPAARPAPASD